MGLYPLKFETKYVKKIWGGRKLESALGKKIPVGDIGEAWEIYDRGDESAVVAQGSLKGQTLNSLVKEFGPRLVGESAYEKSTDRFPLLIKFIDASDWLSVQVHPDDDYAALHVDPDEMGKTEMWYMLAADADAALIAGIKKGAGRKEFKKALKEKKLEEVLNKFSVKESETVFLPAGRVHAIGKGCLIAEIQQNSDTTYRVYDFNRLENGKPRDLHINQALETMRFDEEMSALPDTVEPETQEIDGGQIRRLVDCEYFGVKSVEINGVFKPKTGLDAFHVLMGLQGKGTLLSHSCANVSLSGGETVLVPACIDWQIETNGDFKFLWACPGK